tara:strand:+ start:4069 stop:4446 length:378 start_codon:yes stop_codon:yes gene_type:complete
MKIHKLKLNNNIKYSNEKVILNDVKNDSGVYILYDKNLEIIYVGKADKGFRNRLLCHTSPNNTRPNTSIIPRGEVEYFCLIPLEDEFDRMMSEMFLIKLYKPKYNYLKKRGKATPKDTSYKGGWS